MKTSEIVSQILYLGKLIDTAKNIGAKYSELEKQRLILTDKLNGRN